MKTISELNIKNITFQGGVQFEQEQIKLFMNCINQIHSQNPVMIELGSNDSYYTILFNLCFKDNNPKNICVEACENLLNLGKKNVLNNACENVIFYHSIVGILNNNYIQQIDKSQPKLQGVVSDNCISLTQIINEHNLDHIDILHMDIQGSELSVIKEIQTINIPIRFLFVSIHNGTKFGDVYNESVNILNQMNAKYIFNDQYKGGCGDGLIICELP